MPNFVNIDFDNGLSPIWHKASNEANTNILLTEDMRTNFNGTWVKIQIVPFTEVRLKM